MVAENIVRMLFIRLWRSKTGKHAVQKANNVDEDVGYLSKKILDLMNTCMSTKTISMSIRDPYCMTSLVKSMLKTKVKIPSHCCEKLNEKVAQAISNRRNCKDPLQGSLFGFAETMQKYLQK